MRTLVALCFLYGAAFARPDVSLGYRYDIGNNNNYAGPLPRQSSSTMDSAQIGTHSSSLHKTLTASPSIDTSNILSTIGVPPSRVTDNVNLEPIVTKHFYFHSAPEEHVEEVHTKHLNLGRPEKHYRVVFIKAPEYKTSAAHLAAVHPNREEKTVIYVLSRKPDDIKIGDISTPAPTEPSKPEVYFIKYKTPEEAAHAQAKIQEQYKVLGGSTSVSNEGIAPVTSVIGSLGDHVRYGTDYGSNLNGGGVTTVTHGSRISDSGLGSALESVYVKDGQVNNVASAYLPSNAYMFN